MAYYLLIDDEQAGPLDIDAVADLIERGEVGHDTLAWTTGMDDWAPAGDVAELATLLGPAPSRPAQPSVSRPTPGAAPGSGAASFDRPLDFEAAFGNALNGFKRQFWPAFLVGLVYNLISAGVLASVLGPGAVVGTSSEDQAADQAVLQFSLLGFLLMMVVMPILYGGLSAAMLNLVRGTPVHVGQLFSAFPRGVTLVFFWLFYVAGCALGFLFMMLPSLLFAATFMLTPFVIVESRLGMIDAMKMSFRAAVSLGWWRCVLLAAALVAGIFMISAVSQALVVGLGNDLVGFAIILAVNSLVTVMMVAILAAAYEQARENRERANAAELA